MKKRELKILQKIKKECQTKKCSECKYSKKHGTCFMVYYNGTRMPKDWEF